MTGPGKGLQPDFIGPGGHVPAHLAGNIAVILTVDDENGNLRLFHRVLRAALPQLEAAEAAGRQPYERHHQCRGQVPVPADFADDFKAEEYIPEEPVVEAPAEKLVSSDDRYEADKNKVVYEEFENGKAFLLNFNNYKVIVTLDGVVYTIDAYGYLIVSDAK